jgi:xanthine dehydrogenase iron-sulfur cluster and FAD-binding subunit A
MAAHGYTFANPTEAIAAQWPDPRPTQDEIETAVQDAECKVDTGYRDAIVLAESRSQTEATSEYGPQLGEVRARREQISQSLAGDTG